ncbi:MAG: hypothetical protein ABIZ05_04445 [Pseudonocardiaceae bacterium]
MSERRQAARSLHRDVEALWERIRAEFVLRDGFWLAVLFGAQAPDVAELVARTRDKSRMQAKPATPDAAPAGRGELTPVPGKPIQPSPKVGALLKRAASAVRSGHIGPAIDASLGALDAAASPEDALLAHAWLAQVWAKQDEPVEATRHARIALEGRLPLELDTTVALLEILSGSLDGEIALEAATALVELHRELVRRSPDSPTALRDLSVSLDKVAGIQQRRGQLDDALTAYTESLHLRRRIHTTYGDTPQSLRDLSVSLNNVAGIQQRRGQLDDEGNPESGEG